MSKIKLVIMVSAAFFVAAFASGPIIAQTSSVFVTGLNEPRKIIYAPVQRYFLVSEAGIPSIPNSGRISIITNDGERHTLIDGLPSGITPPDNSVSGPSALWIQGNRLYIAIGNGNSVLAGPAPGSEVPNPNPNSPIFSSILELRLPNFGFRHNRAEYNIDLADHARLANGETLTLRTLGFPRATLRMVANFPDFVPSPRPDVPNNVRPSNPFGLVLHSDSLYVVDAARNNLQSVSLENGAISTVFTYPARPNPNAPMGPPFIDAVPDSLRLYGNKLLVTFLTGFPFPAGVADVRQYDMESGEESQLIGGLRSAIDSLPVSDGGLCATIYTLEFSTNMVVPNTPGRLQRFNSPVGPPTLISDTLVTPTSMARHPSSGDLLVTERVGGRITRISNIQTLANE